MPAQCRPQGGGAGVGVDRQQREFGCADIGSVDPGGGLHQTDLVLSDQRAAAACQHPDRLIVDQLAAQRVPFFRVGRGGDDPALAFGHHLAGDDDDIAVAQPRRRGGDRGGQIVTGPELGKSGDGQDLDRGGRTVLGHGVMPASSSPERTIAAVASGSDISSGIGFTVTPGTSASSPSWMSQ